MTCMIPGCEKEASWLFEIQFYVEEGKRLGQAETGLSYCTACKAILESSSEPLMFSEEVWADICSAFRSVGVNPPPIELTRIAFRPIF